MLGIEVAPQLKRAERKPTTMHTILGIFAIMFITAICYGTVKLLEAIGDRLQRPADRPNTNEKFRPRHAGLARRVLPAHDAQD